MIKNYLILTILILKFGIIGAQINKLIFSEAFDNNTNNWYISDTPEGITKIDKGKYLMEGKMLGKAITSTIPVNLRLINNFKISTEITKINGIDDNGFGLIWGSSDPNNEFEFVISGNGQFKIIEWTNGKSKDLIPWTYNSIINRWDNATNRLSIEKLANIIKFYINDNYVARIDATANYGDKIGFVINENIKISINYLILEKVDTESLAEETTGKAFIASAAFSGTNILRYEESTVLKVIVDNPSDHSIHDLALMISSPDDVHIVYNRISMIEKILAHDKVILAIVFSADENIENKTINFELNLVNSKNIVLDTQKISLKTVQNQFYSEYSNNKDYHNRQEYPSNKYSSEKHPANDADGCAKGCAYISLAGLVAGIILTFL